VNRTYPERPFVGVGAVIVDGARVVLIRRRFDPLAGEWSLPGGVVAAGETLEMSVRREMEEETGLVVTVGPVIEVFDRITRDDDGRVQYHYVLVDYLCWPSGGVLRAGSDVDAAVWVDVSDLSQYGITEKAAAVIARAFELAAEAQSAARGPRTEAFRTPVEAERDGSPARKASVKPAESPGEEA
jgi:8-oxo-dGTP diphosphatase